MVEKGLLQRLQVCTRWMQRRRCAAGAGPS
jgi:hypothetical protein